MNGVWLPLGLTVDELPEEDAETLRERIEPINTAMGAEIPVPDDAGGFKIADELGLDPQICKRHVKQSTEWKNRLETKPEPAGLLSP